MFKGLSRPLVLLFLALTVAPFARPAADIPDWLAAAALIKVSRHPPETEAVYLLDEREVVLRGDGTIVATCRVALRALRPGGVDEARRLVIASGFDTRILSLRGWGVTEGRKTVKVTTRDVVETGLAPDTLYTDIKVIVLSVPGVEVGSLVGFEWQEERKPPSLEDLHTFQGGLPVERSHYSLTLPPGWSAEPYWVRWPALEARTQTFPEGATTLAWDLTDIPAIEDEPLRPGLRALAGRLVVRFRSPGPDGRCFSGWSEIGAWYEDLTRECRAVDEGLADKARGLTAEATDSFGRLRALAEFVQKNVRYVAVEIGIGGFKPHSAADVMANLYGDCKDKATLLAALLQALGVETHYLLVNADRGCVAPGSPPSLYSFNHIVLAIRLPDDVPGEGMPAIVRHPALGRLLVFDPTFPYTPLGRLPKYLQGNTALIVAAGKGELLPLPQPAPETNRLERSGRFVLEADGTLHGEIRETRRGTLADAGRSALLNATDLERRRHFETFLSRFLAGSSILSDEIRELYDNDRDLTYIYRFRAPLYAKIAGGMTIVRPCVVGDKREPLETVGDRPRLHDIDFGFVSEHLDEFTIELPEGYTVDSLPPATDIDAGFAVYRSRIEQREGTLVYGREYRLLQSALPATRYEEAVRFFRAMDADQRQSVLLKKEAF